MYAFGQGRVQAPMFECPVSAVPAEVWTLLDLYLTCRAMHALPKAGGVLDQPLSVRRSFVAFAGEMEQLERERAAGTSMQTTAAMVAAIVGGGRRR